MRDRIEEIKQEYAEEHGYDSLEKLIDKEYHTWHWDNVEERIYLEGWNNALDRAVEETRVETILINREVDPGSIVKRAYTLRHIVNKDSITDLKRYE